MNSVSDMLVNGVKSEMLLPPPRLSSFTDIVSIPDRPVNDVLYRFNCCVDNPLSCVRSTGIFLIVSFFRLIP